MRVAELERRINRADESRGRLFDRLGAIDARESVVESKLDDVRAGQLSQDEDLASLKIELATIKTKVALYGMLGGSLGAGVISFVVTRVAG